MQKKEICLWTTLLFFSPIFLLGPASPAFGQVHEDRMDEQQMRERRGREHRSAQKKDEKPRPYYITFGACTYSPKRDVLVDADTGFGFEASFGRRINSNLAAELGVAYLIAELPEHAFNTPMNSSLRVFPVTFDLVINKAEGKIRPFAKGGIGLYRTSIEDVSNSNRDVDTTLGYQVEGGVLLEKIGLSAKYLMAEPHVMGADRKIDGLVATIFFKAEF